MCLSRFDNLIKTAMVGIVDLICKSCILVWTMNGSFFTGNQYPDFVKDSKPNDTGSSKRTAPHKVYGGASSWHAPRSPSAQGFNYAILDCALSCTTYQL